MALLFKNSCKTCYMNLGFAGRDSASRDFASLGSTKPGSANPGSAILIVVLVMSVLSICCMTFWQNSHLFYDISLRRLEYEQKYRAACCGLDYAVSVCSKNFDTIINDQDLHNPGSQNLDSQNLDSQNSDLQGSGSRSKESTKVSPNSYEIETGVFEFSKNLKYTCKIYITKDGTKGLNLKSVLLDASGAKAFEVSSSLLLAEKPATTASADLADATKLKNKNKNNFIIKNWKVCE